MNTPSSLKSRTRMFVFAGPSGGHLFPALAFSRAFLKRFPESEIYLVTSRKGEWVTRAEEFKAFKSIFYLPNFPFPSGISLSTLTFLLQLVRAFIASFHYLSKIKPHLCAGFGSYASYPGMMLGSWKKIPTLIHEQNLVPGKATLWLAPHMSLVATSFSATLENSPRRVVTGFPVREAIRKQTQAPKRLRNGFQQASPCSILIVGGSQGARRLNHLVLESFSGFSAREKERIAVNHITGKDDFEWVSSKYQELGISNRTYPFFHDIASLYQGADMAITRAGSSTLFEISLFGLPSIVVPYPHASGHQSANAAFFNEKGAVLTFQEEDLDKNPLPLKEGILKLVDDSQQRNNLSRSIRGLATPNASNILVTYAEELLSESREKSQKQGLTTK